MSLRVCVTCLKNTSLPLGHHDYPGEGTNTQLPGRRLVELASGVHDRDGGQEVVQVESQVHLGRCLALAPACPVLAIGHQLYYFMAHRMNLYLRCLRTITLLRVGVVVCFVKSMKCP